MRLIDADAYSAEMKDRQDAAWKWRNEAIAEEDEVKLARAEGAFTAFTEAKLTMDKHIISNPWRRVEDELPQSGEMVMIYDGAIGFGWHEKGAWEWVDTFESGPAKVTHWMPLPEPPKEDA